MGTHVGKNKIIRIFICLCMVACLWTGSRNSVVYENGAPEIEVTDSLSSQMNCFIVRSGNYSWNYPKLIGTESVLACGSHPLDINLEKTEKLKVPKYNMMEATPYMVSCDVTPDRITAKEWDISQAGNVEAAVLNETTYSETSLIEMKPDRIYELTLEWDQKKGTGTGGYGSASYVIVTE